MKRITMIVALAAIALFATAAVASASVAVDSAGHGSVAKGDVQNAIGGNNGAFDIYASTVKFSVKTETVWHQVYRCNGVDYINDITNKSVQPIAAAATMSANGKQITGWNLTGPEGGVTSSTTTYSNSSAYSKAFMACYFSGGTVEDVSTPPTSTSSLYVKAEADGRDVPLPNTPVALPV